VGMALPRVPCSAMAATLHASSMVKCHKPLSGQTRALAFVSDGVHSLTEVAVPGSVALEGSIHMCGGCDAVRCCTDWWLQYAAPGSSVSACCLA
jgi:hypothetical protein